MARHRITKADAWDMFSDVARLMAELRLGMPTLYFGDHANKISNKLMLDGTNLWPDHMAGTTTREAYNALRIMRSTLAAKIGHDESTRFARVRSGL